MEYFVIYCPRRKVSYMSHVTEQQRYTIGVMLQQNYKQVGIAKAIGKDNSVVSREIKRNCDKRNGEYRSELAQKKCESRQKERSRYKKLDSEMGNIITTKLEEKWSPEQISSTFKKN
jgi:transposase, IS30 family